MVSNLAVKTYLLAGVTPNGGKAIERWSSISTGYNDGCSKIFTGQTVINPGLPQLEQSTEVLFLDN